MTTKKTEASIAPTTPKKVPVKKAVSSTLDAAVKPESAAKKPKKESKVKVVRDSFTMPQNEYLKIAEIKEAALQAGVPVKKSEVLRAGLKALVAMSPAQLKRALAGLEKIKTGRPKKH
ncbi:MAG: hypothetical protein WA056_06490 [Gallionella sp.]|jgi:hypothetical protein|nr:hypothetical protein [Gallionella sp.]MCK9353861.1 hypothetical protein [Gallionella sp.]